MPVDKHKYNTCLANYFLVQPLFFDGDKQKKPHLRKCIEQPWQCNVSNNWIHLKQTLFDMSFLQTKCSSFSIYHVLEDFIFAQSTLPLDHSKIDILRLYSILDRYSRIFELAPFLIPQQH